MLQKPFFCHFKPPKEYGRHCHRYLRKVKFFWVIWITKEVPKTLFLFRAGFKSPPSTCRVNNFPIYKRLVLLKVHLYLTTSLTASLVNITLEALPSTKLCQVFEFLVPLNTERFWKTPKYWLVYLLYLSVFTKFHSQYLRYLQQSVLSNTIAAIF